MCLTGVDYFSTLGYQPSIAFDAMGMLAPLATIVLVAMTLGCALPIYCYVAHESPHGQGSIAMLERLLRGWPAKFLVLVLLGFAATDFIITQTLSAADAAEHLVHNPYWQHAPAWLQNQMAVTIFLLIMLGSMFMRGFKEVILIAVTLVTIYLALNALVIGSGVWFLLMHPEKLEYWYAAVKSGDWHIDRPPVSGHTLLSIIAVCFLFFPKLALGLSGFETGVAVMPLVKGNPDDDHVEPAGRIRNARKLLITAAVIMSILLLGLVDRDDNAHRPDRAPHGRSGRESRAGLHCARANRRRDQSDVWRSPRHSLRHQHGGDFVVCGRERHVGAAEFGAPLSTALRHGAEMGRGHTAPGAGFYGCESDRHGDLWRERRGAGRRLRYRCARA